MTKTVLSDGLLKTEIEGLALGTTSFGEAVSLIILDGSSTMTFGFDSSNLA